MLSHAHICLDLPINAQMSGVYEGGKLIGWIVEADVHLSEARMLRDEGEAALRELSSGPEGGRGS